MKIAVVGSGALGLYYGSLLQRGGHDLRFLLRRDYEAVRTKGLAVSSVDGDFHLPQVKGALTPEEIGHSDLVLVGLKTFANDRYKELIGPLVGEKTLILTLQNGLGNEETLADLFGPERILGGVAYLLSNRGEPGTVRHLGQGRVFLGEYVPDRSGKGAIIAEIFRGCGIDCRYVEDVLRARWEKLVWNIPFNGLCALLRAPVERIMGKAETRRLARQIMLEVIAAANAQRLSAPIDTAYADRMMEFTDKMHTYRPSMQIDREEKRPLELRSIFANPISAGEARGVPMPRVEELYDLLSFGEPDEAEG